jgi:NhaP-type Na+/H+ or K+/H+ antiporter
MSVIALMLLLFAATAALRLLADRTGIPLPPLLFWASLTTSLRDLKRNLRPINLLAV